MNYISPNNVKRHPRGMTLIEITLVITILLSLATIIFLGVASFNKGSARAKCVLQQAKLHKMALAYANLNQLNLGDSAPDLITTLVNDTYIPQTPLCPDTGNYTFLSSIPRQAEHFVTCSMANHITN